MVNLELNKFMVIEVLREWMKEGDSGMWYRYPKLQEVLMEKDVLVKISTLKKIMKDFLDLGYVTYGPTVNDDGQINGRGYFLTPAFEKQLTQVSR